MKLTFADTFNHFLRSIGVVAILFSLFLSVPSKAGDPNTGRQKAKSCTVCHGADGISVKPDTPNIAGQQEYYLRNQLANYRSGERFHQQMNIVARPLSDEDIDDLSTWFSSIKITVELPD